MVGENKGVADGLANRQPHIDADEVGSDMTTPKSKSSKSPAFQFYPESWFASSKVKRMNHTEKGIYIDLLAQCWLDNGLPTSTTQIAALVGIPALRFHKLWSGALSECFVEKSGRLVNPRQERERKKQQEYQRRQSDNAEKGWQRRRNATALPESSSPHTSGTARALEIETELETPSSSSKKKEGRPLDVEFMAFLDSYPANRRKGGFLVQQSYLEQVEKAGGPEVLLAALTNHKVSAQWASPKHIPGMDTWLREERWRQELPAVEDSSDDDRRTPAWAR